MSSQEDTRAELVALSDSIVPERGYGVFKNVDDEFVSRMQELREQGYVEVNFHISYALTPKGYRATSRAYIAISQAVETAASEYLEETSPSTARDWIFMAVERECDNLGLVHPPRQPHPPGKAKISARLRRQVFERDEYRCVDCATHLDLQIDHIYPESKGGETTIENLATRCRSCNLSKGTKIL